MRRAPIRASFALLLYLTWLVPAAGMLHAVAQHDEHDEHGDLELAIELANASTHGHRHETATPAHDHHALRPAAPTTATPDACSAPPALPAIGAPPPTVAGCERRPPPTGSPPLFRSHCALLL